jgi:hypothetical protein
MVADKQGEPCSESSECSRDLSGLVSVHHGDFSDHLCGYEIPHGRTTFRPNVSAICIDNAIQDQAAQAAITELRFTGLSNRIQ